MKKKGSVFAAIVLCAALMAGCGAAAPADTQAPAATQVPVVTDASLTTPALPATPAPAAQPAGIKGTRPDGRSYLAYDVIVPGDASADTCERQILVKARDALARIGITLNISNLGDVAAVSGVLDAGAQDLWTAARAPDADPAGFFAVYQSANIAGQDGDNSNDYHILSAALDTLLAQARASVNQRERISLYRQAADEIGDWAVELPLYRRQSAVVFSAQTVQGETIAPDMTVRWGWTRAIRDLRMANPNATLVAALPSFLGSSFNPFYAADQSGAQVLELTQLKLVTTDRAGGVVLNAVEGESVGYTGTEYLYTGPANLTVEYNSALDVTTYTAAIRDDLVFSDGKPLTADDIIFTYYACLDPSYDGPRTVSALPILGLRNYQTQTTPELHDRYAAIADALYTAGADHVWNASDAWTRAQQEDFWNTRLAQAWMDDAQDIVDYVVRNYGAYAQDAVGFSARQVAQSKGLQVAFGMVIWGYGGVNEEGTLLAVVSGNSWNLKKGQYPTIEDFYNEIYTAYEGEADDFFRIEAPDAEAVSTAEAAKAAFITHWGRLDPGGTGGIPNIEGIRKLDAHTVQFSLSGYDPAAVYSLFDVPVAALHFYGDEKKYSYDENRFGFEFGDISGIKTEAAPIGAGPYKLTGSKDDMVILEANTSYYKGAPYIQNLRLVQMPQNDVIDSLLDGSINLGVISASADDFAAIRNANGGALSAQVIETSLIAEPAYAYIGLNARMVCVNGEPDSQASRYLRRALGTVLAVYREEAVALYFGDAAAVIQQPALPWGAAQGAEDGCALAFCTDVEGNPIYTQGMTRQEREEAALQAALGFLEAAGFTVENGRVSEPAQ